MILFILLTLMFKSSLTQQPPFITSKHLGELDEFVEVYEEEESAILDSPSFPIEVDIPVIPEETTLASGFSFSEKLECQVYEETIKQIFELHHARNSTSGSQYRILRDKIGDLFFFDICFERACMFTRIKNVTRGGRAFLKFGDISFNLEHEKTKTAKPAVTVVRVVDDWDDGDFCRRSEFCRFCPFRSSCCSRWCWKTCEDEDIMNAESYCRRWKSADLCKKINHCRCNNRDHGDCFGGGGGGSSSRSSTWTSWSSQDGWDGNDRPTGFFGSDNNINLNLNRNRNRNRNRIRNRNSNRNRLRNRNTNLNFRRWNDYDDYDDDYDRNRVRNTNSRRDDYDERRSNNDYDEYF